MTETGTKVIEVWRDSLEQQNCKGLSCCRPITWARVVKTGARMCFTGAIGAVLQKSSLTGRFEGAREILAVPFEMNHWSTCPNAKDFKRKKK